MEFDLDQLSRDWIAGISGAAFTAKVRSAANVFDAIPHAERLRGVLITDTDPVEFAAGFFGALITETPVILANPSWGAQEWAELRELVRPGITFGQVGAPALAGESDNPDRPLAGLQPGSICIPTGGTTGGMKLATHNWSSLSAAVAGLQDFLGGGSIHAACQLPLFHVSGLMQLVRACLTGGRIHFGDTVAAGDCLSLVPTQLQRALRSEAGLRQLRRARAIFVGGAALPAPVADQARAHRLPVIPIYGMTETAAMVAAVPTEAFLADPQAGAVPLGAARFAIEADGQIRVWTPALFLGYQGGPRIDHARGHLTGDQGRLDPAGRLHVHGRLDRLINTGGEKVDPREVEAALLRIKGIREAQVIGQPDPEWGQRVVAHYTGQPQPALGDWAAQLKASLAPHKIPKKLIQVEVLPAATKPNLQLQ